MAQALPSSSLFTRPTGKPSASPASRGLFKPPAQADKPQADTLQANSPQANTPQADASPARRGVGGPRDWFKTTAVPQETPAAATSKPGLSNSAQQTALNSARQAALAALPGPLAAAFNHVWQVVDDSTAQEQMLKLLNQGKLTQGEGRKVVERLQELTSETRAEGMEGAVLTRQTLALLTDPDQSVFQGMRSTCGAANVQRQVAENPPLLLELVEGLSDTTGKATLPTGFDLQRVAGSHQEDGSGRDLVNRLLQSSLMAAAGAGRGVYDFETGCFGEDPTPGLKPLEMAALTAAVAGTDQVVVTHDSKSTRAIREILSQAPEGKTFQCGLSWRGMDGKAKESRNHMLLFTGLRDGQVSFFDPETHSQGQMSLGDFLYKTQFVLLSTDQIEGYSLPEDNTFRVSLSQ